MLNPAPKSRRRNIRKLAFLASTVEISRLVAINLPSQPRDRRNWQRLARKWSLNCVGLLGAIGVSQLAIAPSAQAATSTLNFTNVPTQITTGTGADISAIGAVTIYKVGDVYRFTNVFTGIDALVTIQGSIGGAKLRILDDNTNTYATSTPAFPARFQPIIEHPGTVNTSAHIQFDVQLVLAGTSTPATAINVYFSAQDIDGDSGTNTIREYVGIRGAQSTVLGNPTLLQPLTPSVLGFVSYEQINSANVQPGIGTDNRYEFYSFIAASASNFSIIGGNILGSAGCTKATTTTIGTCQRQNSYTFDASDVQRLDFGDAPQVYGDAYHSVPSAPTVFFGTGVTGDDAPIYNNTDVDDGITTFPPLAEKTTSYSVTATCKVNGSFVAGWIDFNRNSVFDPGERAAGTCNGTSVTLNWTGLIGNVAGQSYGRFRISSIAAEVANPTGTASDGEVEDYPITIKANATVLLVKRVTAINGLTTNPNDSSKNLTTVVNPTTTATTSDDATRKWPAGYLKGEVDAGKVKPGDTIEYTIYYLNDNGENATNVKICDPIRGNHAYSPNSMKMLPGGTVDSPANYISLTDGIATGVDRANSYTKTDSIPTGCNAVGSTALGTPNGGVAIEITGTGASAQPNLPAIPGATAAGTPTTSYGWFRFTTKVNP